jgi:hypothetical protein
MAIAKAARGPVIRPDTIDINALFDQATVYAKGATILHMLRYVLGDSVFFRALRAYTSDPRFRYGVATTEDFQSVCEATAQRPLDWFFREWLYGESYPRYTYTWKAIPDTNGHWHVEITIGQTTGTSNPAFFVMPLDVKLSAATRDTTLTLFNTYNGQTFNLQLEFQPQQVELDPDERILRDVLTSPDSELPLSVRLLQNYPNPFNQRTTITYEIPTRTHVVLAIYDVLGRLVTTLVNCVEEPGHKSVLFEADGNASGVYLCMLRAAGFAASRKLLLLK